ncbi:hypothetical protein SAMN02745227_00856 [Anaerobranca californiensis DSM 14826]|jgi:hypothetical protein|uniref:Uncharacterized protein n=1 Tax=Anaerobranca californiensis DSM 14826 TaxID=1120989 RepID=A0A1M6MN47_9FIRM|nr:hypothetical protein [Anaerobranca californiensis]SHJ84925.1 hypothetical protein SAMN02745227_00856 [Anaerobranca californiensis DSM 14826]
MSNNIKNSLRALISRIEDKNTFISLQVTNFEGKTAQILYGEKS